MKKSLVSFFIQLALFALIYADHFIGNEYAGNLAIFSCWFIIIVGFLALLGKSEDIFDLKKGVTKIELVNFIIQYLLIAFMVAIGWTVTGLFYLVVSLFILVKGQMYKQSIKESEDKKGTEDEKKAS